ncbi:MAG: MFS transporter [Desulfosarcinaceae bacterium]|nr:MFS transporter [Desulfosarcinaceae bacterium]
MHPPATATRRILAAQYFVYFGGVGIFLPYFNLYCYHLGFSGTQIGALSALRSVVLVLLPLAWGALADRFQARRGLFILCNVVSALSWSLVLGVHSFGAMAAVMVAFTIFYAPLVSFLEAFTMDTLGPEKRRYGRMRVWGSLAFILVVLVLGRFLEEQPLRWVVILILAGLVIQSLMALWIPASPASGGRRFGTGFRHLLRPRVIVFLTAAFLMLVSHGAYYGFFSIHLEELGMPRSLIGASWALAATAEIFVMLNSDRILSAFSYPGVLRFSFVMAIVRWLLLWQVTSAPGLLAVQVLHAFTYGSFHIASILYIDQLSPPEVKTLGQAINNAVTYGLGLMVGFFLSGWGYELLGGTRDLFLASSVAAFLGGALIWRQRGPSTGAA